MWYMFQFPYIIVTVTFLVSMVLYFVMLTDKLNLKLKTFFVLSLIITVVNLVVIILIPTFWSALLILQCFLYDMGSLIHLTKHKQTVKDVTSYSDINKPTQKSTTPLDTNSQSNTQSKTEDNTCPTNTSHSNSDNTNSITNYDNSSHNSSPKS